MSSFSSFDQTVLIIDDEEHVSRMVAMTLKEAGIRNIEIIPDGRDALSFMAHTAVSCILLDLMMPNISGYELLPRIRNEFPDVSVIVVSAVHELETAVECMKQGANDYLVKPVEPGRLIACVKNALNVAVLRNEVVSLKNRLLDDKLENPSAFNEIKTCSKKMRAVFQYCEIIARSSQPVLVTGETGVGKELFARAIHTLSGVRGEFVSLNVAGLDDTLFTDTLFGHRKGAFTGADNHREGLIGKAAGGTLFLDEIGDMSDISQVKLLRLLQEGEYYPVGADNIKQSDARIVVATNRTLTDEIAAGKFRRDLYYRLCTHQIKIPPLHERSEDIPLLARNFIDEAARRFHKPPPSLSLDAISCMTGCRFPGNVRELKAMIFDAVACHEGNKLTAGDFTRYLDNAAVSSNQCSAPGENGRGSLVSIFGHFPTFREVEEHLIDEALKLTDHNFNVAASLLGITRQTIANRLKTRSVSGH